MLNSELFYWHFDENWFSSPSDSFICFYFSTRCRVWVVSPPPWKAAEFQPSLKNEFPQQNLRAPLWLIHVKIIWSVPKWLACVKPRWHAADTQGRLLTWPSATFPKMDISWYLLAKVILSYISINPWENVVHRIFFVLMCRWETNDPSRRHWWLDRDTWRTQRRCLGRCFDEWRYEGCHWCCWLQRKGKSTQPNFMHVFDGIRIIEFYKLIIVVGRNHRRGNEIFRAPAYRQERWLLAGWSTTAHRLEWQAPARLWFGAPGCW